MLQVGVIYYLYSARVLSVFIYFCKKIIESTERAVSITLITKIWEQRERSAVKNYSTKADAFPYTTPQGIL